MPTDELQALLSAARSVCVLTGAGVSQESGIPTFRGADGLWRKYRAEDLATPEAFARDPRLVWEWYAWRRELLHRAQPNAAHRTLAALQKQWSAKPGQFWLVTQNVDGLHDLAGSRNVIRLHGDFWLLRCIQCGAERRDLTVPLHPFPPRCVRRDCSAMMRPGVVWFGEPLPEQEWRQAEIAAGSCDLFLVVGTSALVYPAASLPLLAKENGARLVEINPFPTMFSDVADLVIREKAVDALGKLETRTSTL